MNQLTRLHVQTSERFTMALEMVGMEIDYINVPLKYVHRRHRHDPENIRLALEVSTRCLIGSLRKDPKYTAVVMLNKDKGRI